MYDSETEIEAILDLLIARKLDALRDYLDSHRSQNVNYLNLPDETGTSPLLAAIDLGFVGAIQLLLERGADVNWISEDVTYTPIHRAVQANRLDVARMLLEAGADPESCWPGHSSARYRAESHNKTDFVELFAQAKSSKKSS